MCSFVAQNHKQAAFNPPLIPPGSMQMHLLTGFSGGVSFWTEVMTWKRVQEEGVRGQQQLGRSEKKGGSCTDLPLTVLLRLLVCTDNGLPAGLGWALARRLLE